MSTSINVFCDPFSKPFDEINDQYSDNLQKINMIQLPDELLILISNMLNIYNKTTFFHALCDKYKYKYYCNVVILRLQLFRIISLNIKMVKYNFINFIRKKFNLSHKNITNNECFFYTPFVPNGVCRFCFHEESKHFLNEKSTNILLKLWYDDIYY